jgi:hypothetical protein
MDIKSINLALSSSKLSVHLNATIKRKNLNRFKIVIAIVLIPARHAVTEIIRNSPTNNHSTETLLEKKLLLLEN